jgi:hypothetical protein
MRLLSAGRIRSALLLGIAVLALGTTGCTNEIVGQLDGLDLAAVLFGSAKNGYQPDPQIVGAVNQSVVIARSITATLLGLLGIYCWYKALIGEKWLTILKDSFLGAAFCGYIVQFAGYRFGLDRLIYEGALRLGERFGPAEGVFINRVLQNASLFVRPLMDAGNALAAGDASTAAGRLVESLVVTLSSQWLASLVWLNALGVWIIKMYVHTLFGFAMGLHVILLPLVAVTLLFPPSRYVFVSFMKSFCAVALWPMFFGLLERMVIALPMGTWFGIRLSGGMSAVTGFIAGHIFLLFLNLAFLTVMLGVCALTYGLMFGALRPPKGPA